jgi:hypothetical protein
MTNAKAIDGRRLVHSLLKVDYTSLDASEQERYRDLIISALDTFSDLGAPADTGTSDKGGSIIEKMSLILAELDQTPPKQPSTAITPDTSTSAEAGASVNFAATSSSAPDRAKQHARSTHTANTGSASTQPSAPRPFSVAGEDAGDKGNSDRIKNLLNMQKVISQEETEVERKMQAMLTEELTIMTHSLKTNTTRIHDMIVEQNVQLESIAEAAEGNIEELNKQRKNMTKREEEVSTSLWSSVINIVIAVVVFIFALIVIRIFPKPY